jgi:glycosyltransferase involved in cell wall biosynthesis
MSEDLGFAVAIPAYNRADVIGETLKAVFAQTLPPVEVVVVDDGSTDDLAGAVAPFRDKIIFDRIENSGVEGGRRRATELTSAPWVAWCDSDDLWTPEHLANFAIAIDIFPDADLLISNFRTFGEEASEVPHHFARWPEEWFDRYVAVSEPPFLRLNQEALHGFIRRNLCFPSASAYRRAFYDEIGGSDPRLNRQRAADANLTRRALGRGAVTILDTTPTTLVRKGAGNISRDVAKSLEGKIRLLRREVAEGEIPERFFATARTVIDETEAELLWTLFESERDDEARSLARSLNPAKLDRRTRMLRLLLGQPKAMVEAARRAKALISYAVGPRGGRSTLGQAQQSQ